MRSSKVRGDALLFAGGGSPVYESDEPDDVRDVRTSGVALFAPPVPDCVPTCPCTCFFGRLGLRGGLRRRSLNEFFVEFVL